jgi:hypothetical protein
MSAAVGDPDRKASGVETLADQGRKLLCLSATLSPMSRGGYDNNNNNHNKNAFFDVVLFMVSY